MADLSIQIGSRQITPIEATLSWSIDTGCRMLVCTIPWLPGEDKELDAIIKPRSFAETIVKIDKKLMMTGYLYRRKSSLTNSGSTLQLECYSRTKELIRSNRQEPLETNNLSLEKIALLCGQPFGIGVVTDEADSAKHTFKDMVTLGLNEKIFAFLQRLSRQKGVLITDNEYGDIKFTVGKTTGIPILSIVEGDLQRSDVETSEDFSIDVDDTKVFATYRVALDGPLSFLFAEEGVAVDPRVPLPSYLAEQVGDQQIGGIIKTAEWVRNKSLAESIGFDYENGSGGLPVHLTGWYDRNGEILDVNQLISIASKTFFLTSSYNFLIKGVSLHLTEAGETADLEVIPPSLLAGGEFKEPWG